MDSKCGQCKAICVTAGITGSYLIGYSAYDKETKCFNFGLLPKIFSFKNLTYSFKQINKVVGLVSLTTLGVGYAPENSLNKGCEQNLLKSGVILGLIHAFMSSTLYYKNNPIAMINGRGKNVAFEVPALILGITASSILTSKALNKVFIKDDLTYFALAMAIVHFYFIETPTGKPQDLPVRPYGYMAFISSLFAVGSHVAAKLTN